MPKREVKRPGQTGQGGAYSTGVLCDGWLFVTGQVPRDPKSGRIIGKTLEEQTRAALENLDEVLRAAGCTRADVVKCSCHLADLKDFPQFDKAYAEFFGECILPARKTVQSGLGEVLVELDAIARVPQNA